MLKADVSRSMALQQQLHEQGFPIVLGSCAHNTAHAVHLHPSLSFVHGFACHQRHQMFEIIEHAWAMDGAVVLETTFHGSTEAITKRVLERLCYFPIARYPGSSICISNGRVYSLTGKGSTPLCKVGTQSKGHKAALQQARHVAHALGLEPHVTRLVLNLAEIERWDNSSLESKRA